MEPNLSLTLMVKVEPKAYTPSQLTSRKPALLKAESFSSSSSSNTKDDTMLDSKAIKGKARKLETLSASETEDVEMLDNKCPPIEYGMSNMPKATSIAVNSSTTPSDSDNITTTAPPPKQFNTWLHHQ
jgi:hypothetical protein